MYTKKQLAASLAALLVILLIFSSTTYAQEKENNYVKGKWFDRVMILMFENQAFIAAIMQPYFQHLATKRGSLLGHYYAVTHPSQPNYLTTIAGDFFQANHDSPVSFNYTTIVDLLEAKQISWKSYQEDYPANATDCFTKDNYPYQRKHNPFMTFETIRNNGMRCSNIVNGDQLLRDVANKNLPQFMYYTPNMRNDGHDTNLSFSDKYLRGFLDPLLDNPYFTERTLILVTFDEDNALENNHIYAAITGDAVTHGIVDYTHYNHYSFLRTVEDNWALGTLGRNDDKATAFNEKLFLQKQQ